MYNRLLTNLLRPYLLLCVIQVIPCLIDAQEGVFTHFFNNKARFNPAMVANGGSFSVNMKTKQQWDSNQTVPFRTAYLSVEESLLCSIFDYGIFGAVDEEGDGLLRTYDFGFQFAGTGRWDKHNLKFGAKLGWGVRTIDFGKLVFSDELSAKYGTVDQNGIDLPTSFVSPVSDRSNWYFTPSIGMVYKGIFKLSNRRYVSVLSGISVHHFYNVDEGGILGNNSSLLGIYTPLPQRYNFFFQPEFPFKFDRGYVGVAPLILYQAEESPFGDLSYLETGAKMTLSRLVSLGLYYHFNPRAQVSQNTRWYTFNLEIGLVNEARSRRVDLGLSYSHSVSGLRNEFGPIFELSLSWHFRSSPSCQLMGYDNLPNNVEDPFCPNLSKAHRKLYENIWYKGSN